MKECFIPPKPEMTGEELLEDKEAVQWMFVRSKREGYRIDMLRPGVWKLQDYTGSSFYVVEGTRAALVIDTGFGPELVTPVDKKNHVTSAGAGIDPLPRGSYVSCG